ncbi:hypothetical protein DTW90_30630 [Neorhizobium sp. P12A]|uniref:hypothetical protein n=1 Tax=Neorhizobium sp. P12A TaxID=2268027 RepID=UPI0011EBDABB|nr:hypothetical protein [Neorhizobium sp. P12A]KAA0689850.1 hypothetical protein DTW90_30630 [Neorhizobium sp. P12A]
MTDIVITNTAVVPSTNAVIDQGFAGETIAAGKVVFLNTTTNRWMLTDNNGTGTRSAKGIALNGASAGQPVTVQKGGDINLGAVLTAGVAYYASGTPGGICPVADLVTGMDPILIGVAKSTSILTISIQDPGVTL